MFGHGEPGNRVHGGESASGCEPLETGIQSSVGSIGQFLIMWACPLGQLPVDLGSRFRQKVLEAASKRSVKVDLAETEAHWENGAAEQ